MVSSSILRVWIYIIMKKERKKAKAQHSSAPLTLFVTTIVQCCLLFWRQQYICLRQ